MDACLVGVPWTGTLEGFPWRFSLGRGFLGGPQEGYRGVLLDDVPWRGPLELSPVGSTGAPGIGPMEGPEALFRSSPA
jgi:hypothetical protein